MNSNTETTSTSQARVVATPVAHFAPKKATSTRQACEVRVIYNLHIPNMVYQVQRVRVPASHWRMPSTYI